MNLPIIESSINQFKLTATLIERDSVRYTPSGLMALNCRLSYSGNLLEANTPRVVNVELKAVVFDEVAKRLQLLTLGSQLNCSGFITNGRNSKSIIFHIQDFFQID